MSPVGHSLAKITKDYEKVYRKAMRSRDPKILNKIEELDSVYEEIRAKLEREAEKTIDPELRREWKQALKIYKKETDALARKLK